MRKKIKRKMNQLTSILNNVNANGILPFTEGPSDERTSDKNTKQSEERDSRIGASDLFSFFTANIIKEEVVFTR